MTNSPLNAQTWLGRLILAPAGAGTKASKNPCRWLLLARRGCFVEAGWQGAPMEFSAKTGRSTTMASGINRLTGKIAVVTGGAQGIGRGIVHRLAQEGAKVAVADINESGAAKTAAEISAVGGSAFAVKLDVTKLKDAMAAAEVVERQLGPVDILVNNAGWDKVQHFLETDEELWNRLIDINFRGMLNCVKAFAPRMLNRPGSKIISIASDAGRSGGVNDAVYSGCKGAVMSFTKALARELARYKINVNAVAPGVIDTPLSQAISGGIPGYMDRLMRVVPLRRKGLPEDIAAAVAYLASADADYVTGQIISVNGGMAM
jgi:2-hydroxycyclohexanecarboxyl-CoA dehydrogenase